MTGTTRLPAIVIGAGSAGLSTSYFLQQRGVAHAVLERERVASSWSRRWDSFTLVTPNKSVRLPGAPFRGPDPDAFMPRDALVAYFEAYAREHGLPVQTGVEVGALRPLEGGGWVASAGGTSYEADNVVVVTGAFPEPRVPPASRSLAPRVFQLHTSGYKNPRALPEGGVLIIGGGQSGVQIAEELLEAGRRVIMCIGKCPRVPRRYGDGTRPRVMPGRRLARSVVEGRRGPERLCWCQVPPAPGGNLRRQARKQAPPAVGTRARQAART